MSFLAWLEGSSLAILMRDSLWAYPIVLTFHAIGMGMLVGTVVVVSARVLGLGRFSVAPLQNFFLVVWIGLAVNAVSGLILFLTAPSAFGGSTHFFFSPTFRVKILLVLLGVVVAWLLKRTLFRDGAEGVITQNAKVLASLSIVLWIGATMAGRLTAYLP